MRFLFRRRKEDGKRKDVNFSFVLPDNFPLAGLAALFSFDPVSCAKRGGAEAPLSPSLSREAHIAPQPGGKMQTLPPSSLKISVFFSSISAAAAANEVLSLWAT